MNSAHFEEWFEHKLLPNLPAIIMDNGLYHLIDEKVVGSHIINVESRDAGLADRAWCTMDGGYAQE